MDVDRLLSKAAEETKRRNFDYSIHLYQEILGLKPDLVDARRGLRQAELKKYSKRYPSRLESLLKGGLALVSVQILRLARRSRALLGACERYLEHDPRHLGVNRILGRAAAQLEMIDTAILVFEGISEQHPRNVEALKMLGELYQRKGDLDRSLESYEKALGVNPQDAEADKARKNLAAEGAIRSSGIDRAASSKDLIKDKDQLRRIEASKRIVMAPEEIAREIEDAEARLKEAPDDVGTIRQLAELYYRKGDVAEASQVLEEALELQPDAEEIRARLGDWNLRRLRQRTEEAQKSGDDDVLRTASQEELSYRVEEYRRRVRVHPTDSGNRFRLGSALLDANLLDEAIAEFQHTIRDPKHRLDSLMRLGECFFRKKMYDLASKQLQEALQAASGSEEREQEIHYQLGSVYEATGNATQALEWYSRVYEKNIQYRDVAAKIKALNVDPAG